MENLTAKELLEKYKNGSCNELELALLESWYLKEELSEIDLDKEHLDSARNKVWTTLPVHQINNPVRRLWPNYLKIAIAALIVICSSVGLYFINLKTNSSIKQTQQMTSILPGGKKAILKLADGSSISLTDVNNGEIVDEAGVSVVKTANGELSYNADMAQKDEVQINTLVIPNGGYYVLTLADGSKVWLNSASSLKYPTAFKGSERIVELTGEGYFEVAHRDDQPFKVITNKQTVEVLGTHFNINAYDNEPSVFTTLLQGSVKVVASQGLTKFLKPGQQSNLTGNRITVKEVQTEDAIAWTTNSFVFNNEELGSIMRKISRWYDVEVICSDKLSHLMFNGSISRTKNIEQVLEIMQLTESIHFKFEGRRITVMP